jgi:hypothetical protein
LAARLLCALGVLALTACDRLGSHADGRSDWVIRTRLVFTAADLGTARPAMPLSQFRLVFPYILGDLYGTPGTGDFFSPVLSRNYAFEIDLNRNHRALLASLEPTDFSESYLRIEPPAARVARLAPMALQADGIDQVGRTDWMDSDSRRPLLLLFLDRPANISGKTVTAGRTLRYDIRSPAAGYFWVGQKSDTQGDVYTVVPRPAHLVLAVTESANALPTVVSPAHTDTVAQ